MTAGKVSRIGVLTGGGDCPGLNAVLRAVVKTAINEYGWDVLGIEDGFEGLIPPGKVRPLRIEDVRGILPRGGTILGTTNRSNPFGYRSVVNGAEQVIDVSDDVLLYAKELGIDALIVIGGDGSLRIAAEMMEKGLPVVGVPKTIDNDIGLTEASFGFDTAVNTAMDALDKLHTTAESHHRTLILEVMGRNAGWIALKAGIAGGADVILIPEIPYRLDVVIEKVRSRQARKDKFCMIVTAEGARAKGGEQVYQPPSQPGEPRRLGGIGELLAAQIRERTGGEARATVLGYLQRGGSPSAFDRLLSSRFGAMSVHLVAQGKLGQMVALQNDCIVDVPISAAISQPRLVPLHLCSTPVETVPRLNDLVQTAFGLDICLGETREIIERF